MRSQLERVEVSKLTGGHTLLVHIGHCETFDTFGGFLAKKDCSDCNVQKFGGGKGLRWLLK